MVLKHCMTPKDESSWEKFTKDCMKMKKKKKKTDILLCSQLSSSCGCKSMESIHMLLIVMKLLTF
jgi:hypothetical protein